MNTDVTEDFTHHYARRAQFERQCCGVISRKLVVLLCLAFFVAGLARGCALGLEKEEKARQKRREENTTADVIISRLEMVSDALDWFRIKNPNVDENYDLSVAFDTTERAREKIKPLCEGGCRQTY